MNDRELMNVAIQEALESTEPLKCACVIAKNGEIIAMAHNSQRRDANATAHAEIKALGMAGSKLGQKNLSGCIAYCTCEPCTMCISAMVFAKIDKLYFGVSLADVSNSYIRVNVDSILEQSPYRINLVKNYMQDEVKKSLGICRLQRTRGIEEPFYTPID